MNNIRHSDLLQLAFRIPNKWNPLDLFLKWKIGKYIHVELVFPDKYIKGRTSFSSRGRSRIKGCRFKKINYNNFIKWQFFTLPIEYQTEETILKIRQICLDVVKDKPEYDYVGAILNAGLGLDINDRKKYWCSEIIASVLGLENCEVTPVELYNFYIGRHYE